MAIRSSWATGEVLTSDDLTDTVADKVSRQGDTLSGQLDSAQLTPMHQFAADGSVLANLPARVHPAEQLLKQAVWWIDAAHSSASGQSIKNLGWGGSALDAQVGSTGSADSNDPKYLAWEGENYVYLPGVSGNYLSVPDEAALDITGDIDIRVKVALDDWTPAVQATIASKWTPTGNQKSWALDIHPSGRLYFYWSADGATALSANSTVAPTVADGGSLWVRATLDVDNGASGRDIKFWTSADGVAWTQLGTTVTQATATSIYSGTSLMQFGGVGVGALIPAGSFHRAQVLNGINGTPVLDIDCSQISSGADTSFTALTGQTVSINRSTSGRKTVGVVHPRWLFGTDDYMEVPDNDLIDFGASDSFTVLAVMRVFGSSSYTGAYKAAGQTGTSAGWVEYNAGVRLRDGTNSVSVTGPTPTDGAAFCKAMVVDRLTDTMYAYVDTASVSGDISTVGDSSNGNVLRIGGTGNTSDNEFTAAAIWRRALTSGEIATLNSYFQGREGA